LPWDIGAVSVSGASLKAAPSRGKPTERTVFPTLGRRFGSTIAWLVASLVLALILWWVIGFTLVFVVRIHMFAGPVENTLLFFLISLPVLYLLRRRFV